MFRATVTKNDMILEGDELITSGSVKTNFVIFTFDAVWDGIVKTAVFRTKKVQIPVIIDEVTLKVAIPWEAMAFPKETIELGVYGVMPDDSGTEEIDEEIVIPTIWKTLGKVVEGTTVIVPPPTAPTKDSYKQLLEYILALKPGSGEGDNGFSPTVNVEEAEDGSGFKVTITDVNGPKEFFIHNGVDGQDGSNGTDGTNGEDGVSPTFSITELANGYTLTITDANGEQTINIYDGSNGTNGKDGADGLNGQDGATFTPSVSESGDLSWTNDKDLPNPPTVNIKGPPGEGGSGGGVDFDIDDTLVMDLDNVLGVKTPVKGILNREEYDALPEEEKNAGFYIIDEPGEGSSGESSSPSNHIYSTEEHVVGAWIDGRPVYEITVRSKTPIAPASNESYSYRNVLAAINDFGALIGHEGMFKTGAIWRTFPHIYSSVGHMYIACSNIGRVDIRYDKIGSGSVSNYTFEADAYVTIKYIKLSDNPEVAS